MEVDQLAHTGAMADNAEEVGEGQPTIPGSILYTSLDFIEMMPSQ